MHEKNLSLILEQYMNRFDELNDPNGNDEGYKWRAESCFKEHWDIDAADFLLMFKKSIKGLGNLIDNKTVQPLGGILMLLNYPEEIEFVRAAFRELFSEDFGDIDARQSRVYVFMQKINERIEKYVSGSWKYPQKLNDVIYYLNLWRPEENYIFKANEAVEWANCIEFGDDFGLGKHFSLKKYYRMCDDLLEIISQNPKIMELHKKRFEKEAKGYDDKMHILVYDIIYCAKQYGFYTSAIAATTSTKKRIERARIRQACEQEKSWLEELKGKKEELAKELGPTIDLTGIHVSHKLWKTGKILSHRAGEMEIEFSIGIKKFKYPGAFAGGFLVLDDAELVSRIEKENYLLEEIKNIGEEINKTEKEYQRLCALL